MKPSRGGAASTAGAAAAPPTPARWGLERLLTELPVETPPEELQALDLKGRSIAALPPQLKFLAKLRKLDLSRNAFTTLPELHKIASLSNVQLSHNELTSIAGLAPLQRIAVLNVSHNRLTSLAGIEGSAATLRALVANNNALCFAGGGLRAIAKLSVIDTIVLSRNPLVRATDAELLPAAAAVVGDGEGEGEGEGEGGGSSTHVLSLFVSHKCGELLSKLSLAACGLRTLPEKWFLPKVTELRLANNSIAEFPPGVLVRSLKILDISNNRFASLASLGRHTFLTQLSVHGNPVAAVGAPGRPQSELNSDDEFRELFGTRFRSLAIVDGAPFVPMTADEQRRQKRAALLEQQMQEAAGSETSGDDAEEAKSGVEPAGGRKGRGVDAARKTMRRERPAVSQRRPPEELPDVAIDAPEEIVAARKPKAVIKREKVYAHALSGKNVVAAGGENVLEMLKAARTATW